jgi:hypothetical protein
MTFISRRMLLGAMLPAVVIPRGILGFSSTSATSLIGYNSHRIKGNSWRTFLSSFGKTGAGLELMSTSRPIQLVTSAIADNSQLAGRAISDHLKEVADLGYFYRLDNPPPDVTIPLLASLSKRALNRTPIRSRSATGEQRLCFPSLSSDGLNGVTSVFNFRESYESRGLLAGPSFLSIPGVIKILGRVGFKQNEIQLAMLPKQQSQMSLGAFESTYKVEDRYTGESNSDVRFFYQRAAVGQGNMNIVLGNIHDPVTGKEVYIENTISIVYEAGGPDIPTFWPLPQASATARIESQIFNRAGVAVNLEEVSLRLEGAFNHAGYSDKSWYAIPNGFALVSRIEQFSEDGTPVYGRYRWIADKVAPYEIPGWTAYIRALFRAKQGHYRVIAFAVTDKPFTQSGEQISQDQASAWQSEGVQNGLPSAIGRMRFTRNHTCTGLVYEFERATSDHPATFRRSSITGEEHLQKSKIWSGLLQ